MVNLLNSKIMRKIKSTFTIYADSESILVTEDDWNKIQNSLVQTNIKKHVACSYGYKLVSANDKFSEPFKTYLGEDAVYNFVNSMIKESNYCSDMIKKHLNKELVITKEDMKILRTLLNVGCVTMIMLIIMLK